MSKAISETDLIRGSAFFDGNWYLTKYRDVALLAMDPAEHYAKFGWRLLRDPGPKFNTRRYLNQSPDVANSGRNPLLHYMEHGRELPNQNVAVQRDTSPKSADADAATRGALIEKRINRAELASAEKDWRQAVLQWRSVLDQSGDNATPSTFAALTRAYLGSRDLLEAAAVVESGLSRFPAHYGLSLLRADVLNASSQWAEAVVLWRDLLDADGRKVTVGMFRKFAQALRGIGDYSAAKEVVTQAEALYPGDAGLKSEAAELLMVEKQWSYAALHWSAVIEAWEHADAKPGYAIYQKHVCEILDNLGAYCLKIRSHQAANGRNRFRDLRVALFTAVVGSYDSITLPAHFPEDVDYVLFTDGAVPDAGAYLVRPITYLHEDPTRSARYVKTHPHVFLADYDIAIWIDGNILLEADIRPLVSEFLDSGKPVGAIPHPLRRSPQEELRACGNLGKDDLACMEQQLLSYQQQNLPASDLIESGFMMFDLREPKVPEFLADWWRMIENHSKRDQLSLPYALARSGIEWHRFTEPPNSIRNHPCFVLIPHGAGGGGAKEIALNLQVTTCDPYSGDSYASVRQERIFAQRSTPIDIIVCVHNAIEDVKICLNSILTSRDGDNQHLILVDDGSSAETATFLAEFASRFGWVTLIRNEQPGGYTKAANQGLAQTKADFCILLNSDTIVTNGWAEKLADAIYTSPGAGIVGPMSSAASHQSIPDHRSGNKQTAINPLPPGLTVEHMNRYCEEWTINGIVPRVPLVHGFCFGIKREVIEAIGLFDETNFPKGYGEENDYCLRATDAGFSLIVATHTYVFHAKSKSYASAHRELLMKSGSDALKRIYGKPRLTRAIRSMESNRLLDRMRQHAFKLYPELQTPSPE